MSDTVSVALAASILLPAIGLVIWAWWTMTRIEKDLSSLGGFEGLHFEIGPHAAVSAEGVR